jgi:nucleotide-binding universal stress UspA family protein
MQTVEVGKRINVKEILFATDFSTCSYAALPYAVSVARRYGAMLHAAYVEPLMSDLLVMSPESWAVIPEDEHQRIGKYLEETEQKLKGIPHDILTPTGDVPEALAEIVAERNIDLLVLGTHGRSGVRKLLLGSVAEEIFRRANCPVLSVGPYVPVQPNAEIRFYHILFATDFGKDSLAALPYAFSLAEEDEARLTLLHVVEQPASGIADIQEVKSSLQLRLKELVPAQAEPWCQTECAVELGRLFAPPAEQIVEAARERAADLIVLGARSHNKLGLGTHLASTTAHILTQAACPVLTVGARPEK